MQGARRTKHVITSESESLNQSYKSINQSRRITYLILFVFAQTRGVFYYKYFHDSSPSCIFMSNKDRRDENGDSNCTGSVVEYGGPKQRREK